MLRRLLCALALAAFVLPLHADDKPNPAITPAEKDPSRHKGFLEDIKKKDGKIDVVFLGDSITDGWRGTKIWDTEFGKFNPINLGISGDSTQHVLWRLQHDELKRYTPKAFVIMIGTNNASQRAQTPEQIAAGVKAILDEIQKQHPQAKILLLAVFPRGPKPTDELRVKVGKINELIAKFDGGNVKFKDIGKGFLAEGDMLTKEIMPDYLHLSAKGYQIWADSIKSDLEEMTK